MLAKSAELSFIETFKERAILKNSTCGKDILLTGFTLGNISNLFSFFLFAIVNTHQMFIFHDRIRYFNQLKNV